MPILLQTIAECLLAFFYIFLMIFIVTSKAKVFRNSFFSMFVATGIADVISIISLSFLRLNRELYLGEEYKRVVLVALVSTGTAYIAHMIGNMVIALNRYSAICFTHQYDKIWTRKNVWIIVVVQNVVALSACIHLIRRDLPYIRNPDGTSTFKGLERQTDMTARCIYVAFGMVYAFVSICINLRMFFEWRKMSQSNNGSERKLREKSLLMYTMLVFISTMLMCSLQTTLGIAVFIGNDIIFVSALMQIFWANYIMVSIPPFSLLLLSSDLRSGVFELFCIKKLKNNVVVSVF